MKIVVKKVPKFLRGFIKLVFGIKEQKNKIGLSLFLFYTNYALVTFPERKHFEHT